MSPKEKYAQEKKDYEGEVNKAFEKYFEEFVNGAIYQRKQRIQILEKLIEKLLFYRIIFQEDYIVLGGTSLHIDSQISFYGKLYNNLIRRGKENEKLQQQEI